MKRLFFLMLVMVATIAVTQVLPVGTLTKVAEGKQKGGGTSPPAPQPPSHAGGDPPPPFPRPYDPPLPPGPVPPVILPGYPGGPGEPAAAYWHPTNCPYCLEWYWYTYCQ